MKTPEEIFQGFLRVVAGASQIAIDRNADSGVIDFDECISQAKKDIQDYYISILPKKKDIIMSGYLQTEEKEGRHRFGYNNAIQEATNTIRKG